ncbi:hypothetical protein ACNKHV_14135 [Shigella flexneri]
MGYWQWHQQNGTNPLCDGADRVLPVPTQVASRQCVEVELFAAIR